ncbi:MAG: RNA methyltransferase [Candidatus Sericytochromatia bacterium]|nr:RNA methyltransferase [Candidatus Sericytochromatia bacterium]
MNRIIKQDLLNYLYEYISENKKNKIKQISANRTPYITVVLEDIEEPKDASAVMRTCECFGVQGISIIENSNKYRINPDVTMGASKWLDIEHYKKSDVNNTELCINNLKEKGYKIVAMIPDKNAKSLEELKLDTKTAFMFGSEINGLTKESLTHADEKISIPMYGFTQSYNLSVSVAITVNAIIDQLIKSNLSWKICDEELLDLQINWVKRVIKKAEMLEKNYFEKVKVF